MRTVFFVFILAFIYLLYGCEKKATTTQNTNSPSPTQSKTKADFEVTIINSGQLPCNVTFTNRSINGMTVKWFFGDGDSSAVNNPVKIYTENKIYSVTLIAFGAISNDTITKKVTISPIDKSVVVYLITPKDKKFNPAYFEAVKTCMINLQTWYKVQMGNNKTFVLNPIIVDTLTGRQDSIWYNSYNGSFSGSDPRFYGYFNAFEEMRLSLGNRFDRSKNVFVVFVAAPGGGAGSKGFCAMGDQDLKGLLGINTENTNKNRWIGGIGHEVGHAFDLPHPNNQNPQAIMWSGYSNYPNCILQDSDRTILNASPFIR